MTTEKRAPKPFAKAETEVRNAFAKVRAGAMRPAEVRAPDEIWVAVDPIDGKPFGPAFQTEAECLEYKNRVSDPADAAVRYVRAR